MDPLKKHNADNFNIKPHERTDATIKHHNFVHQKLMALINYIKNALRSIAYAISPKSNPANISHSHVNDEDIAMVKPTDYGNAVVNKEMLSLKSNPAYGHLRGEDIAMVKPTDCGNEVVNQEMLKFSDNVRKFWDRNTPKEVVDFFMKSAIKNSFDIYDALSWAHLVEDGAIPNITQDELAAFSNIRDRVVRLDMETKVKKHGSIEFVITFRDIKNFYNVFVKYMNYAIKNDPRNAAKVADLEKLFFDDVGMLKMINYGKDFGMVGTQMNELFDKSKVSDSDRNILRSDNDFLMLLQGLKEYVPAHKMYESGLEGNTFYNVVGNILGDNEEHPMNYTDLKRLKRSADIVGNILVKKNNGKLTKPKYYCDMLYEASKLGLTSESLGSDLRELRNDRELSEKKFEAIILKHGFGEKMSGLMTAMESLPDIVNKTLAQIDLNTQLKHVIKLNVLHESY